MGVTRSIVETVFAAKDKLSKTIERMTKKSQQFGSTTEAAFKKASKSASRFSDNVKGFVTANIINKGLGLLSRGIGSVIGDFVDFDDSVTSAAAKFKGLNITTAEGAKVFDRLKKKAREVGATTRFSGTEAAQGLDFLALAGFNAEQAMAALEPTTALATVGNIDLGRAVDIASDSLGAFGLMTEDSAQLQENLRRVNDNLAQTMASTNTNIEDMFEAIKKGAPDFTAAGQSIETFTALLGVLANSGKKGSEAGIALKTMMLRLTKSSPKVQKEISRLGITVKDSNGNFLDAIDILSDVEKATKKMGTATRAQTLNIIFGDRALGAVNILLKEGTAKLKIWRQAQIDSAGAAKRMADVMEGSLGAKLKSLQSVATELGFKFLEAFQDKGAGAIDTIIDTIRKFNVAPIVDGVGTVLGILGDLFTLGQSILLFMSPFIAAFAAYNVVMTLMNIKAIATAVGLKILTAAQWLLNIALSANPIGFWIAAFVGLIAIIALVVSKWDVLKKAFFDGAKAIFGIFQKLFSLISSVTGGVFDFVFGDDKEKTAGDAGTNSDKPLIFRPPNENEAKAQKFSLDALLRFENAPPGLTGETSTDGAPAIAIPFLGTN